MQSWLAREDCFWQKEVRWGRKQKCKWDSSGKNIRIILGGFQNFAQTGGNFSLIFLPLILTQFGQWIMGGWWRLSGVPENPKVPGNSRVGSCGSKELVSYGPSAPLLLGSNYKHQKEQWLEQSILWLFCPPARPNFWCVNFGQLIYCPTLSFTGLHLWVMQIVIFVWVNSLLLSLVPSSQML